MFWVKIITMNRIDRKLLAAIFTLSWPTVLEQVLLTAVQYIDTAMVGQIGAAASAAVGITTSSGWLLIGAFSATGVGVLSCVAKAIGAKDYERASGALVQAIFLALIVGAGLGITAIAVSPFLPVWLGAGADIQRDASAYFFITNIPAPLRAAAIILGAAVRATGETKKPMQATIIAIVVNIVLNALLIGGPRTITVFSTAVTLPGAGLGVVGAAIATACCYVVNGLLMFVALIKCPLFPKEKGSYRINRSIFRECVKIGMPVTAQKVVINLGHIVFTALISELGTVAIATHTIALTAEEAFYIPGYGMQIAAATMAGNAVGEGDTRKLKTVSLTITAVTAALIGLLSILLFLFPASVMAFFSSDPEVIRGGANVLRIVAVSEPLFAVAVIMEGVFDGTGEVLTPFLASIFSMWVIRILLTYICVSILGLGLNSVWICMVADNTVRCFILVVRFFKRDWSAYVKRYAAY